MFTRRILPALLVTAVVGLFASPAGAIEAIGPAVTIEGSPTAVETVEIQADWAWILDSFPAEADCIAPITVVVVDSAEAAWGGGVSGIASFYRVSIQTVYVEHGKVSPDNLIHEFAHHVDFSCGFGSSSLGAAFSEADGFAPDHRWISGSRWSDVPAEHFAEAVVGYLGIDSVDLPVTAAGFEVVASFATTGFPPIAAQSTSAPRDWS